jgi:hypothetical protein
MERYLKLQSEFKNHPILLFWHHTGSHDDDPDPPNPNGTRFNADGETKKYLDESRNESRKREVT